MSSWKNCRDKMFRFQMSHLIEVDQVNFIGVQLERRSDGNQKQIIQELRSLKLKLSPCFLSIHKTQTPKRRRSKRSVWYNPFWLKKKGAETFSHIHLLLSLVMFSCSYMQQVIILRIELSIYHIFLSTSSVQKIKIKSYDKIL